MSRTKTNVLLLSAGRRVELLQAFKNEVARRHLSAKVYATDLKPKLSAACHVADRAFSMPRVTDKGYMDHLLELCIREDVGLVVPTIDTELLGLAEARDRFAAEGVHLVISDESLIYRCRDKRHTRDFFCELEISTPRIMDRDDLSFPCFAKPFDGSRSVGAAKLNTASEFTESMRNDSKMMFMEYIDTSHEEYTVDIYFDRAGHLRCLVPRHRVEIRDGEVNKGVTRRNHVYTYLLERLNYVQGARGCLTLQIFAHPTGNRYAALEINPRFGGGFPLSYAAGANYPGWLIDEYLFGRDIQFFDRWEPDLLMLRYDAQVLVHDVS